MKNDIFKKLWMQLFTCADFLLNSDHLILIDTTPESNTQTYVRLAGGIANLDPNSNDELDQTPYLDGDGYKTSTVTGGQFTIALTGHRKYDDPAQNFIYERQQQFGCRRETNVRFIRPDGTMIEGPVTLANITGGGGDSGMKGDIAFEIHFNGKPAYTPVQSAAALSATIAAGSVTGTTKATATAAQGNSLAYSLSAVELNNPNARTKFDGIAYTSGEDIVAEAGQWLLVVEIDEYNRVVEFTNHELQAGDIAS